MKGRSEGEDYIQIRFLKDGSSTDILFMTVFH